MTPPPASALALDAAGFEGAGGGRSVWRKLVAFAGPGYLVAVGYMDPGNWATDLAGGSAFRLAASRF